MQRKPVFVAFAVVEVGSVDVGFAEAVKVGVTYGAFAAVSGDVRDPGRRVVLRACAG
jgi:hypothetical protein